MLPLNFYLGERSKPVINFPFINNGNLPPSTDLSLLRDGLSRQSTFKQHFADAHENVTHKIDFMIPAEPLQLSGTSTNKNNNICVNPCPSLMKRYRRIKFNFVQETGSKIIEEIHGVTNEIENLFPSSLTMNDSHIS